jgi:hypothetical protein
VSQTRGLRLFIKKCDKKLNSLFQTAITTAVLSEIARGAYTCM